jgi:hypothetical protein
MVDYIVNENGVDREATETEKADIIARNKAWEDDKPNRQLSQIREIRNQKLIETDYLANSDVVMPNNIKTWRQSLRDLPQDFSTEEQYDLLLARDEQGNLTHSIWSKP